MPLTSKTRILAVAGVAGAALLASSIIFSTDPPRPIDRGVSISVRGYGDGEITRFEKGAPDGSRPDVYQIRFANGEERHFTSDSEALKELYEPSN